LLYGEEVVRTMAKAIGNAAMTTASSVGAGQLA
jgi:hypothetical protein